MKDLIDIMDLSVADIQGLIDDAVDMMNHPEKYDSCMKGKRLAALFYEPSTRTRLKASWKKARRQLLWRI